MVVGTGAAVVVGTVDSSGAVVVSTSAKKTVSGQIYTVFEVTLRVIRKNR